VQGRILPVHACIGAVQGRIFPVHACIGAVQGRILPEQACIGAMQERILLMRACIDLIQEGTEKAPFGSGKIGRGFLTNLHGTVVTPCRNCII